VKVRIEYSSRWSNHAFFLTQTELVGTGYASEAIKIGRVFATNGVCIWVVFDQLSSLPQNVAEIACRCYPPRISLQIGQSISYWSSTSFCIRVENLACLAIFALVLFDIPVTGKPTCDTFAVEVWFLRGTGCCAVRWSCG